MKRIYVEVEEIEATLDEVMEEISVIGSIGIVAYPGLEVDDVFVLSRTNAVKCHYGFKSFREILSLHNGPVKMHLYLAGPTKKDCLKNAIPKLPQGLFFFDNRKEFLLWADKQMGDN